MNTSLRPAGCLAIATALAGVLVGCGEQPVALREIQRVEETITKDDLELLSRIAERLREGRLPEMSPHFLPPPEWGSDRPATVATLGREELARLRDVSRLATLSNSLTHDVRLQHILKLEHLNAEQYVGLVLAVGTAAQRTRVDPSQDLENYVTVGRRRLKKLAERDVSFAALPLQKQLDALEEATWITRVDRAERLLRVSPPNVATAEENRALLDRILPRQFLAPPLAGINVPMLDAGVPFRERPETGFDAELFWTRTDERAIWGGETVAAEPDSEWR